MSADRELLIRCDCYSDVLLVTDWDDRDGPNEMFWEFYERPGNGSLRWRVGAAWRVLRGRHWSNGGGGIALSGHTKVEELRDFLTECLDAGS